MRCWPSTATVQQVKERDVYARPNSTGGGTCSVLGTLRWWSVDAVARRSQGWTGPSSSGT